MPTVPGLLPDVAPSETAVPSVRVSADATAFGGTVGQALSHLGASVEHASDQIWQRAVALQQLRNESEAKEADAQYMVESGKLHAEYSTLQGKNKVDALEPHMQALQKLRTDIRGSLKTEQSQKMYDASSLGFMGRNIFNAAGQAASANKTYAAGASTARIDEIENYVEHNPKDEDALQRGMIQAKNEIYTTQAPIHGWGEEQIAVAIKQRISSMRVAQIRGLAKDEPFAAQKLLDEHRDELYGPDLQKTDDFVRTQRDNVGARVISQKVNAAPEGEQQTMQEVVSAADKEARTVSDDPIFLRNVENTTIGDYNKRKQIAADTQRQNTETVNAAIGKGASSITELRSDPVVAKAIDALPHKMQNDLPGVIRRYTASATKEANEQNYNALVGKQYTSEGRAELMGIDPTAQSISQKQVRDIWKLQEQIRKSQEGDPRVNRAIGWLRQSSGAQLEALGVYKRTDYNKDDYDQFAGSVAAAVDDWQAVHGKAPSQKEMVEQIGPALMRQTATMKPQWLGPDRPVSDKPMFKVKPPEDFIEGLKRTELEKGNPEPDEFQTDRAWRQVQWMRLHKPTTTGAP